MFCFKQKAAYEMRISDWSSDVCSSDLALIAHWSASGMGTPQAMTAAIGPAQGPVLVMSGSRSPVTAAQIAASVSYPRIPMDADGLCTDRKSVVLGKSVSVRVDRGCRRIINNKIR